MPLRAEHSKNLHIVAEQTCRVGLDYIPNCIPDWQPGSDQRTHHHDNGLSWSSKTRALLWLTLIPLGYFEDLSPLAPPPPPPPPQISATNGPIDLKIGTVVKQVK